MYRVIIAEDELFVRLGIKMSVDWEKLGMEVVADVSNGKQAWEVYEREHPDIILTDIKMPIMDGMELIRRVREESKETRIIILSCLEEFGLVREAISMDVSDYILKLTMTQEDMEKVLRKVKTELESLRSVRQEKGSTEQMQRRKLLDFFYYNTYGEAGYKEELQKLKLPFGEKNLLMAVIEVNHYETVQKRFGDEYGMLIDSALSNVLTELMGEYGKGMVLEERGKRYILIAEHGTMEQKADAEYCFSCFLGKVRKTLSLYLQIVVTIGVSQLFDGYEHLRQMYQQCSDCLDAAFFHDIGENLYYSQIRGEDRARLVEDALRAAGSREEMDDRARALLGTAKEVYAKNPDPDFLKKFVEHLLNLEAESVLPDGKRRFALVESKAREAESAETLKQVLEVYLSFRKQLYLDVSSQNVMSRTVAGIVSYISKNYGSNLPLEQIAEAVELSPNYICGLFKKEMGVNLSAYIMEYRINKAKELLVSTNLKSYEIAEKTGFSDESYFSRSFKKVTGQSPYEFRRALFIKEG